jgi:hypothetical protein
VITKAVNLVKEAAPKIVEVLVNDLVTLPPDNMVTVPSGSTDVVVSRPFETIVLVPVSDNATSTITPTIPSFRPAEQVVGEKKNIPFRGFMIFF